MSLYDHEFFGALADPAKSSALQILPIVLDLIGPKSVVDVGCGTGDWLATVRDLTACEILGVDGDWVPSDRRVIPSDSFLSIDLSEPISLGRRFDLAISLEVAEHLPPARGDGFVRDLTELAPAVLFSAAVPGQGGLGHVNERWQSYWIDRFASVGFEPWDVVRPAVWNRDDVAIYYRQNTLLFVDPEQHGRVPNRLPVIADAVHPQLLASARQPPPLPGLGKLLGQIPGSIVWSVDHRRAKLRQRRTAR